MSLSSVITIRITKEEKARFRQGSKCGHIQVLWLFRLPKSLMETGMTRVSICGALVAFFLQCYLDENLSKLNSIIYLFDFCYEIKM